MKLTVLGCWAPYPRAGGACLGYLLQDKGSLLLDCGNGTFSNLSKYIDFRKLDGAIISHFHPDHYMDVFCLRHAIEGAIREGSRKEPLPLYVPATPIDVYEKLKSYSGFQVHKISSKAPININGFNIRFFRVEHALEAYGMLIKGSATFGYTADTRYFHELTTNLKNCDLLLSEASVLEKDKDYAKTGHLTVRQAARLGIESKAKQIVISHFWPEYNLDEIFSEAKSIMPNVKLGAEGKIFIAK